MANDLMISDAGPRCWRIFALFLLILSQAEADECALRQDCASCQEGFPNCAWCGTSGVCAATPAPMREYLSSEEGRQNVLSRVFALLTYSDAEFDASFGGNFTAKQHFFFLNDTSCGLWLSGRSSCYLGQDMTLPGWAPCTNKPGISECLEVQHERGGCGYCLGPGGGCVPGTLSGKVLFGPRSRSPGCAADADQAAFYEEPHAEAAESVWLFSGGRAPEVPIFQTCREGHARYVATQGRLVMGDAVRDVSYAQDLSCSWEIWPAGQVDNGKLSLELNVTSLRYEGDYLELVRLDLFGSPVSGPAAATAARGPALLSFNATGPVRVQFRSFTAEPSREAQLSLGVWSVAWSYEEPPSTTSSFLAEFAAPEPANPPDQLQMARTIMITTFIILLLMCAWLYIWRAYVYIVDPNDPSNPSQALGLDLTGLEARHPGCKPQVLGASTHFQLACSVCLCNFQPGDVYRNLPCNHCFHQDCIDFWLKRAQSCPTCRSNILEMQEATVPTVFTVPSAAEPEGAAAGVPVQGADGQRQRRTLEEDDLSAEVEGAKPRAEPRAQTVIAI